jgi:hypothetical protein
MTILTHEVWRKQNKRSIRKKLNQISHENWMLEQAVRKWVDSISHKYSQVTTWEEKSSKIKDLHNTRTGKWKQYRYLGVQWQDKNTAKWEEA